MLSPASCSVIWNTVTVNKRLMWSPKTIGSMITASHDVPGKSNLTERAKNLFSYRHKWPCNYVDWSVLWLALLIPIITYDYDDDDDDGGRTWHATCHFSLNDYARTVSRTWFLFFGFTRVPELWPVVGKCLGHSKKSKSRLGLCQMQTPTVSTRIRLRLVIAKHSVVGYSDFCFLK